jgi:hypothetical protein
MFKSGRPLFSFNPQQQSYSPAPIEGVIFESGRPLFSFNLYRVFHQNTKQISRRRMVRQAAPYASCDKKGFLIRKPFLLV